MVHSKNRRRIGMAAAALLLGSTIGFSGPSAGAAIAPKVNFTPFTAAGQIEIAWASPTPTVSHVVGTTPVRTIPIVTNSKCEVTNLVQLAELLTFSASTGGGISLYDNGLGISSANANCTPANGRVDRGQSLTLGLGTRFATGGASAGPQIIGGALDIEGKFGASLRYSTDDGTTSRAVPLTSANDNGSDADSADNTRVQITSTSAASVGFTSIRLEATGRRAQAAIALDNGGDWSDRNANKTILALGTPGDTYEYTVNCGDEVNADAQDNASDGSGADSVVSGVSFFRLANKNQTTCAPIGVIVQASNGTNGGNDDDVLIDNSTTSADGTPQNVRARVRIIWVVETAGKTPDAVEQELAREIDYTPADAAGLHPVQWCSNVPSAVAANPLTATDIIGHPANEPWCLLTDVRTINGTKITQTQLYSANGDPRIS